MPGAQTQRRHASLRRVKRGRYPLVLPHVYVRRVLDRRASVLILTRRVSPGIYEIHDAQRVGRNRAHCRNGRPDLQTDPAVLTIEVVAVERYRAGDLPILLLRQAGYKTSDEFRGDWIARRRTFDAGREVLVCAFRITGDRYLSIRPEHGYTSDPAQAAQGENGPIAALDQETLNRYARSAFERDDALRRERIRAAANHARAVMAQLRQDLAADGADDRQTERLIRGVERTTGALERAA